LKESTTIFERIKSEGLAHNSYFIGSEDEAVVIDPRKDCDVYIEMAQREEVKIKYVFETHRNALFVGDVGRIDLYGPEEAPRLAAALYDSIFNKILLLGDGVILCPAHGAGSVCGGNISDRDESTIGIERTQNPVLQLINIVCNVGHRASLAASILLRAGYPNVCCDVLGSTTAWRASKFPMTRE